MKKYISSILAGAMVLGLAGCGTSSGSFGISDANVSFADLNATGTMGYQVNVDLNFLNDAYDASNIDYYFCTDANLGLDYYAYTQERANGPEIIADKPDFDYGYLAYAAQSGILEFTSDANASISYEVTSASDLFATGAIYDITLFMEATPVTTGTVHINRIANFDCAAATPVPVSK
ncbi:hypothetical protein WCX18_08935 [Sulfurimonas sp. HSL1-2]|uniref:hypothetical protein n=1 Tax=Thiomicrolovo zhangzhouensis TaxID=3131933 RepID=UPI0031F94576